jgi:hypothetical protein
MTDNLHFSPRLEGEQKVKENVNSAGTNNIKQVSLEAIIRVLIKRGICTEAELLAEEKRLRAVAEMAIEPSQALPFTPVQTHSERHRHRREDNNRLRRWAAKRNWSRKLGTLLFGWKWHRKKNETKI